MKTSLPTSDKSELRSFTQRNLVRPGSDRVLPFVSPSDRVIEIIPGYAPSQIMRRIARSMLGKQVTVRGSDGEAVHGLVTGVLAGGGNPRVVVQGFEFPIGQVLTVAPAELGS